MDRLRRAISREGYDVDDEEQPIISHQPTIPEEPLLAPKPPNVRGFTVFFLLGFIFSVVGSFFLFGPNGKLLFGVFYAVGNITAISSTCFLKSPAGQMKKIFSRARLTSAIFILTCLVLTLFAAFWWETPGLSTFFCLLQFLALTIYSFTFIPAAREAVKKFLEACAN
ncbi:vesicle transport protein SFT2A-like [Tachypleus tridentatus]|uniref:vesicle transport protein SFT2A-like n=1 Tax=Tachypleus tridentatus TaxID=6853 RepID=UPI003FD1EDC6